MLWAFGAIGLAYETYKTVSGRFRTVAFRPEGQAYVPFVDESFYKAWGPVVLAADAARVSAVYLCAVAVYVLLFRPFFEAETRELRAVMQALRARRATERAARSNGGS